MITSKATGQIVPFSRTFGDLSKRAHVNHKSKRYFEAVSLFLRAYEAAPNSKTLLALSDVYRDMGCYRLSNRELYRALALDEGLHEAFYGLAVNHYFLGNRDSVADSAALYLKYEPQGLHLDEAQELLLWAFPEEEPIVKHRTLPLLKMAERDEQRGFHDRAIKRIMRAAFLCGDDMAIVYNAVTCLVRMKEKSVAIKVAASAVKAYPNQAQAICALAMAVYVKENPSRAMKVMGQLRRCERNISDDETVFKTVIYTGARFIGYSWFEGALCGQNYDTDNIKRLAYIKYLGKDKKGARLLFNRCLAVDPEDLDAQDALGHLRLKDAPLSRPGSISRHEIQERMGNFIGLLKNPSQPISARNKRVLDWVMSTGVGMVSVGVLNCVLERAPDRAEKWFKMWLLDEDISTQARKHTAYKLAAMQPDKMNLMLSEGRLVYSFISSKHNSDKNVRASFIKRFLYELRGTDLINDAAAFAIAQIDSLNKSDRAKIFIDKSDAYLTALKIYFLRSVDRENAVRYTVNNMMISTRRVWRAMKIFFNMEGMKINEAD